MTGLRVTSEAVAAAFDVVYPEAVRGRAVPIGGRAYVFGIIQAAAEHLADDRVAAALALHCNDHGLCSCCDGLIRASGGTGRVLWPCATARALGVEP